MAEWRTARLGVLFDLDNTKLGPHSEEPTVFSLSKYDGFVRSGDYFDKRIASANLDGYKVVVPGGWAFSTIHIDEGSIARNELGERGVISPMYTTMTWKSERDLPEYVALLLRSPRLLGEYARRAQGSVNRRRSLPFKSFAEIEVQLPPLPEQRRVVDLVAAVSEQIEALEAEMSAAETASHELLEYLLSNNPLRPLGGVLTDIEGGRSPLTTGKPPTACEQGVLKVSAVGQGRFLPSESKALLPGDTLPASTEVRGGDLLITRANTPDRVGAVCRVPREVRSGLFLCDKTLRLVPDETQVDADFLVLAMRARSVRAQLSGAATGTSASMANISQAKIRATAVPLPDLTRQRHVSDTVGTAFESCASLSAELVSLRSFRTALLTSLLNRSFSIPESYDAVLEPGTDGGLEVVQ